MGRAPPGRMGAPAVSRLPADQIHHLHSAGGVVVREREPAVSTTETRYQVAVMRSNYGTWVFPKGGIHPGETCEEAARRELHEEVGLAHLALLSSLDSTAHQYQANGRRVHKQVDWFLFLAPPGAELAPDPAEHALDAAWFDTSTALSLLTHASQRNLLRRALRRLQGQPPHS